MRLTHLTGFWLGAVDFAEGGGGLIWCREMAESVGVALYVAAQRGDVTSVKALLEKGADVHTRVHFVNKPGKTWTPLHSAAEHGHMDVVNVLLAAGAKVQALSDRNRTNLLRLAAKWRQVWRYCTRCWRQERMLKHSMMMGEARCTWRQSKGIGT
jgi:hypothetical protein